MLILYLNISAGSVCFSLTKLYVLNVALEGGGIAQLDEPSPTHPKVVG
jgi:hypothetical protein